jgi:Tfp pilus assembly protein PilF
MKKLILTLTFIVSLLAITTSAQNELFNKALEQFEAKQYEQASITFGQVIAQSPNFYQAHFNLGLCYYNLKRSNFFISKISYYKA